MDADIERWGAIMSEPNEQGWLLGEPEEGACGAIQRYFCFKRIFFGKILGVFFSQNEKKVYFRYLFATKAVLYPN